MKLANLAGRLNVIFGENALDVEQASEGLFVADPQAVYERWQDFVDWVESASPSGARPFDLANLGPPVPKPAQIFAIGVNYAEHAAEAGYPPDSMPVTFTKFPTCLAGPSAVVELPSHSVDWEVELVVAISKRAERVQRAQAWDHVAGLTVGQDLSERQVQMAGTKPQFSLGKSFPGFGPIGPWLVTPDELHNPNDLAIGCTLSGEVVQNSRTSRMIYDIADLIERLSSVCPLLPGDLIFTGTPAGVGNARTPKRFIRSDDLLVSSIEGIGSITTQFNARPPSADPTTTDSAGDNRHNDPAVTGWRPTR